MSDYVASVVPSSRGAHGLFQSSLPSRKPFIFWGAQKMQGMNGWDGDGWDGDGWGMDDLV